MSDSSYKKQAAEATVGIDRFVSSTIGLVIRNDAEQKDAAGLLADIRSKRKELNTKKKAIIDPLNTAVKEVRNLFRGPEEQLSDAELVVKDAMLAYHEAQEAEAQRKIAQVQGRLERGTMKVETGIAKLAGIDQAESHLNTENGSVQFRNGPEKVRITNVDDLLSARPDLLQRERVMEALRLELAADIKAGVPVPNGAEVYREKTAAVRT